MRRSCWPCTGGTSWQPHTRSHTQHHRHAYDHILAPSTTYGKNLLPRLAALLDTQAISDVQQIIDATTFVRPIYAGNALATVQFRGKGPCAFTVRTTGFDAAAEGADAAAEVKPVAAADVATAAAAAHGVEWLSEERRASVRPDLGSASVVVSGGRALKTAENFKALERIADLLGGAVGATRAAVDAGMVPNDLQVGQRYGFMIQCVCTPWRRLVRLARWWLQPCILRLGSAGRSSTWLA